MSLKEIKKHFQIAGKGHKEILEFVNSLEHKKPANNDVDGHVPENGAREIHNYAADVSNRRSKNTI
jgi:hypothetical protein